MTACRTIRSSNGQAQTRYVIRTTLALDDRIQPVEFTSVCRRSMCCRVLSGPKALIAGQLAANPALAYVQDRPESPAALPVAMGISLPDGGPVRAIRRQHLSNLHPLSRRPVQRLPRR